MDIPMVTSTPRAVVRCAFVLAGSIVVLVSSASIAEAGNTWTGGGASTNWSDNGNWGGTAPTYGTLTFTTGGAQGTTSNNNSISAMNQLFWSGSTSWTLNGSTTLSLFDNGGTQAKIENQSSGLVTINDAITFAANNGAPPNPFGEINAVNGDLTFGTGTLTVNGSSVNGIKLFGSNRTTTFNNTVTATGKWFSMTSANDTMVVGGAFTSGEIYVQNGGTLKLNSGGTITSSAVRLGGELGGTNVSGQQNLGGSATLQFTSTTGGQSFASIINTVAGNTSNALLIDSLNTSGTNTINGNIFLDSALRINQASGGTTSITNATLDLKAQTLTLTGTGGNVGITGIIGNSTGSGQVVVGVNGTAGGPTVTLSSASTYSGDTFVRAGTLAFTSAGSAANSTIRLGSTSGTSVDASVNLTTLAGGTTISSVINPVATSGSGALSVNSQNTSGTNTYSGHIGADRDLTITQAAGGSLNVTQVKGVDNTTGTDIKGFTLTLTPAATGSIGYSGTIYNSAGNGAVTKTGAGTTILTGSNTFTGATTIGTSAAGAALVTSATANGGTLVAGAAGALGSGTTGTASIAVNNGGTLLLAGAGSIDRVKNTAPITLGTTGATAGSVGGTISTAGLTGASETLGSLTLSSNSTLDFGNTSNGANPGNSVLFASLAGVTGQAGGAFGLTVNNWSGNYYSIGTTSDPNSNANQDRLLFTSDPNFGLGTEISSISFFNDSGNFIGHGMEVSFGSGFEIVAIPEPTTIFGALGLVALVGLRERRRITRAVRGARA